MFETRRALRERRQRLRVVAAPGSFVAEVLEAAAIGDIVPIDASLDDAVDAVSRPAPQG